jgi:hypothetical protein
MRFSRVRHGISQGKSVEIRHSVRPRWRRLFPLTLQPFAGPILSVKTGHSFTKNAHLANAQFQGLSLPADWPVLLRLADAQSGILGGSFPASPFLVPSRFFFC